MPGILVLSRFLILFEKAEGVRVYKGAGKNLTKQKTNDNADKTDEPDTVRRNETDNDPKKFLPIA